jgi:nucleotide-binding universal stress UspA family protein
MSTAPQIVVTPTVIRNILFTTDFSAASARALPYALSIARQHGATVNVAHVIKPTKTFIDLETGIPLDITEAEARNEAWKHMDALLLPQLINGVNCTSTVREGGLWECVSRLISQYGIDLLILGTKGAGGLTKVVLGSGAEELFHEAPCPVMTIGPHVGANGNGQFKEILFALDFTDQSMHAYPYALEFATESHGCLTVLHVVLPIPVDFIGDCGMAEYKEMMRSLAIKEVRKATDYARHPVRPHVIVDCGNPPKVIVQYSRELPADLIVMGVQHRSRFAAHIPWTVTHEVVSHAPCPVLTVRS